MLPEGRTEGGESERQKEYTREERDSGKMPGICTRDRNQNINGMV